MLATNCSFSSSLGQGIQYDQDASVKARVAPLRETLGRLESSVQSLELTVAKLREMLGIVTIDQPRAGDSVPPSHPAPSPACCAITRELEAFNARVQGVTSVLDEQIRTLDL